jgi:hypothetical protein
MAMERYAVALSASSRTRAFAPGALRLSTLAVALFAVVFEDCSGGDFLGALDIASFFSGRLENVLVLSLLFRADARDVLTLRHSTLLD